MPILAAVLSQYSCGVYGVSKGFGAMFAKLVIALVSLLVLGIFTSTQVVARGSGHSMGKMSSSLHWHRGGRQRMHSPFHHTVHFSHQGQHSHPMTAFKNHEPESSKAQGRWFRSPGFGDHASASSNSNGEWHEVHGFGNRNSEGKSKSRSNRQATSDERDGNCNVRNACQGVWYEVPEN